LTLRGIGRELGVTAPAIYNYFPHLDDLITALIIDAFTDLGEAMQAADSGAPSARPADRALAQCLAYRRWATEHPLDFQLIYGNPIPGYIAPADITIPLARRPFLGLFACFLEAHQAGELQIPAAYAGVPAETHHAISAWQQLSGIQMPDALLALLLSGWARIHGMVMLELFHHIQPLVGEGEAFLPLRAGGLPPPARPAGHLAARPRNPTLTPPGIPARRLPTQSHAGAGKCLRYM